MTLEERIYEASSAVRNVQENSDGSITVHLEFEMLTLVNWIPPLAFIHLSMIFLPFCRNMAFIGLQPTADECLGEPRTRKSNLLSSTYTIWVRFARRPGRPRRMGTITAALKPA